MRAQDVTIANLSQATTHDKLKLSSSPNQSTRGLPDGFHDVLERSLRHERHTAQDTVSPIKRNRYENERPHRDDYYQSKRETQPNRPVEARTQRVHDTKPNQNEQQKEPATQNHLNEKAQNEKSAVEASDQTVNNSSQTTNKDRESRAGNDTETPSNILPITANLGADQSGLTSSDAEGSEQNNFNPDRLEQAVSPGQGSASSQQLEITTSPLSVEEQNQVLAQNQLSTTTQPQLPQKSNLAAKLDKVAAQLKDGLVSKENPNNPEEAIEAGLPATGLATANSEPPTTATPIALEQTQKLSTAVANDKTAESTKATGLNGTSEIGKIGLMGKPGSQGQIMDAGDGEVSGDNASEGDIFTLAQKTSKNTPNNSAATALTNAASNTKALSGLINAGQHAAAPSAIVTQIQNSDVLNGGITPQDDGIEGILPGSSEARINGLSQSSQLTAAQRPASLPSPAAQQLALQITQKAIGGNTQFEVRLNPPELGRVDVRLEFGRDGTHQAHLVVERSETLDLLQRDQRHLERALSTSGFDLESGDLKFSLKEQGQDSTETGEEQVATNNDPLVGDDSSEGDETAQGQSRSYRLNGVDIKV